MRARVPAVFRWIFAALAVAIIADCAPPAAPPLAAPASEIEIVSPPLQGFYGKRLRDGGIPILGHASVSDEALFAARDRLRLILERAPKIRQNLEARGHELHIVGLRQYTSDLPEHRSLRGTRIETGELFDWHMIGGHIVGWSEELAEGLVRDARRVEVAGSKEPRHMPREVTGKGRARSRRCARRVVGEGEERPVARPNGRRGRSFTCRIRAGER